MITQNMNNLLSALAPAAAPSVVPMGSSTAQNARFDAALLDAAKVMRDGSGSSVDVPALTPKVERALESLLNQLAQKPAEVLRQWASQPENLKSVVEALAQSQGLDAGETVELKALAPLATQRLVQALDTVKTGTGSVAMNLEPSGKISGPQGGEPGTPAQPANDLKPQATAGTPGLESVRAKDERSTQDLVAQAQASVWVAATVSTRTDTGSSADSALTLASRPVPSVDAAPTVQPITVTVNTLAPTSPAPTASLAAETQAPAAAQNPLPVQPQAQAQPQAITVSTTSLRPVSTGTAATQEANAPAVALGAGFVRAADAEEAQTPVIAEGAPNAEAARSIAVKAAAPLKSEAELNLDFKVAISTTPRSAPVIEDGTLFVLNSDGSTQGSLQVSTPNAPAQPQAEPATAQVLTTAAAMPAPAPVAAPAPQELPTAAPNSLATLTAAATGQAQATVAVVAAPIVTNAVQPVSESFQAGSTDANQASSVIPQGPSVLENSAGFQALKRSGQEDATPTGFSLGQGPLRQIVDQAAKDLGIREAAFTQVSEAVASASRETSRLVVKLKPASLGEVHIDLSMVDGKLTAKLLASSAEVRDAFVRDLPAFKANLEAMGLRIDQLSVAVRADSQFNPQGQSQPQAAPELWSQNAIPAGNEASAIATNAWADPASNEQLFSALA